MHSRMSPLAIDTPKPLVDHADTNGHRKECTIQSCKLRACQHSDQFVLVEQLRDSDDHDQNEPVLLEDGWLG
jgi:hypothetical protein